jgi:hypothetical protein
VKYQVSPPNAASAAPTVALILPTLPLGSRDSNIFDSSGQTDARLIRSYQNRNRLTQATTDSRESVLVVQPDRLATVDPD